MSVLPIIVEAKEDFLLISLFLSIWLSLKNIFFSIPRRKAISFSERSSSLAANTEDGTIFPVSSLVA